MEKFGGYKLCDNIRQCDLCMYIGCDMHESTYIDCSRCGGSFCDNCQENGAEIEDEWVCGDCLKETPHFNSISSYL